MRELAVAAAGVLAATVLAVLPAKHSTREAWRPASAQPRDARLEDLARDVVPAVTYARAHSFWGETLLTPCIVGAVWQENATAAFAPLLRLPAAGGLPAKTPALEPGAAANVRVVDFRAKRRPRPERHYDTLRRAA